MPPANSVSALETKSENPLLTGRETSVAISSAKRTIDAFMDAVFLELAREKASLSAYLTSYDTANRGSIPIDDAARILVKIAQKWMQSTPFGRPTVERALRTLSVFDHVSHPEGEIGHRHLFHICTTNPRTRKLLAGSIMRRARRLSHGKDLTGFGGGAEAEKVNAPQRAPSEMDREGFCRVLAATMPSLQPYEISMCWEVHRKNGKDGRGEEMAPTSGTLTFTVAQLAASKTFCNAFTFCIVLNAVSMMLDDPLCDPVDSSGSTKLCIFRCAKVISSMQGHPCDAALEITRQQLEFFLLVAFTAEMGILMFTMKYRYFANNWNQIDFAVICLSWVFAYVDGPSIAVVRLIKLLRTLRAFKRYQKMQVLATSVSNRLRRNRLNERPNSTATLLRRW